MPKEANNNLILKRVEIRGLFNVFDYDIDFENDKDVSILIAPNGCGKTTILNFIAFLLDPSEELFHRVIGIPITSFACYLTNGTKIVYTKINPTQKTIFSEQLFEKNNFLYEVHSPMGIDVQINFSQYLKTIKGLKLSDIHTAIINKMKEYSFGVKYIPANRLQRKIDDVSNLSRVKESIIKSVMNDKRTQVEIKAKNIDKFVNGFNNMNIIVIYNELIHERYKEYKNHGLMQEFVDKCHLFEDIYNERNAITKKTIKFVGKSGRIEIELKQKDNIIPLNCLSSGEKNYFSLLFQLIFDSRDSNIIMIDEPEISLHIDWQEGILEDILTINKITNNQVIIATHSPYVVGSHFDLLCKKEVKEI